MGRNPARSRHGSTAPTGNQGIFVRLVSGGSTYDFRSREHSGPRRAAGADWDDHATGSTDDPRATGRHLGRQPRRTRTSVTRTGSRVSPGENTLHALRPLVGGAQPRRRF